MKKTILLLTVVFFSTCLFHLNAEAQILKKIKKEVTNRAERNVIRKAGDATDKAIDSAVEEVKDGDGDNAEKASNKTDKKREQQNKAGSVTNPATAYKNYDFVPGEKIIFQPDLSKEPDAELPARFLILNGTAEIQTYQGEKILHLGANGGTHITPLIEPANYLPDQFTIEFDMLYENEDEYVKHVNTFALMFRNAGDAEYNRDPAFKFAIEGNDRCFLGTNKTKRQYFTDAFLKSMSTGYVWHSVAIYVNKNVAKAYIDGQRVAATNMLPSGATNLSISTDRYGIKLRNFRMATDVDDKYKKIVTDGRFVTHGIQFDVNRSTIKPESMGTLNEIARIMKEHQDLRFEIQGHTDSDGKTDANLKLSQERAEAVKARLVELGIDASRFTTKGFGSAKPLDSNESAEGKARNRRVEFVKF